MAKVLGRRLDEIRAAKNLEVVRAFGRCHELHGDRKGQFSMDLVHPQRLIFTAAEDPPPRKTDGGLNWSLITSVVILGIHDTHE